jgi:hypothetical protein
MLLRTPVVLLECFLNVRAPVIPLNELSFFSHRSASAQFGALRFDSPSNAFDSPLTVPVFFLILL